VPELVLGLVLEQVQVLGQVQALELVLEQVQVLEQVLAPRRQRVTY
jgi:hypothetical protein